MPSMPPLHRPKGQQTRRDADRAFDHRRLADSETRRLYKLKRWAVIRDEQLGLEPFCRKCTERGEATPATICDHVEPHGGDVDKFWAGPFQSLCDYDHNKVKQAEEAAARKRQTRPLFRRG